MRFVHPPATLEELDFAFALTGQSSQEADQAGDTLRCGVEGLNLPIGIDHLDDLGMQVKFRYAVLPHTDLTDTTVVTH